MPKLKNISDLSLYVNLPGGGGLKIRARETVDVSEEQLSSPELAALIGRGNVIVLASAADEAAVAAGAPHRRARAEHEGGK